jgi:SAM-dependent methyltransferase
VVSLRVHVDASEAGTFPVDVDRADLAPFLSHLPFGTRCGYDFELPASGEARSISFDIVLDDGTGERLFDYDVEEARRTRGLLASVAHGMPGLPVPPGDLVALTQGISDPEAYRVSILPGVLNLRKYLAAAGVDESLLRSILDFGCGSGRLLAGWHLLDPERRLHGCDIRQELVSWATRNFPTGVEITRNDLEPPLSYGDGAFDLVYAASVFTHLSVSSQRGWQRELRRVLRRGGILLVTLHGSLYVRLLLGSASEDALRFARDGHLEKGGPGEGSNAWTSFHTRAFAEETFDGFRLLGYFPAGRIGGRRILFPVASLQDVYVLQRR